MIYYKCNILLKFIKNWMSDAIIKNDISLWFWSIKIDYPNKIGDAIFVSKTLRFKHY
jgi:hypothetical protein